MLCKQPAIDLVELRAKLLVQSRSQSGELLFDLGLSLVGNPHCPSQTAHQVVSSAIEGRCGMAQAHGATSRCFLLDFIHGTHSRFLSVTFSLLIVWPGRRVA